MSAKKKCLSCFIEIDIISDFKRLCPEYSVTGLLRAAMEEKIREKKQKLGIR